MIAAFSHRSISVKDCIVLANGLTVDRDSAHQAGVEAIFDRVLSELVSKMRDMNMDRTELGCLRTIILFNPGLHMLIFVITVLLVQCTMEFSKHFDLIVLEFQ